MTRILVRNAVTQISLSQCSAANSQEASIKRKLHSSIWKGVFNENRSFLILHTNLFKRLPNVQFIDAIIRKATSAHYFFPVCPRRGVSRVWEREVEDVVFERMKLDQWRVCQGLKHSKADERKKGEVCLVVAVETCISLLSASSGE